MPLRSEGGAAGVLLEELAENVGDTVELVERRVLAARLLRRGALQRVCHLCRPGRALPDRSYQLPPVAAGQHFRALFVACARKRDRSII